MRRSRERRGGCYPMYGECFASEVAILPFDIVMIELE